MAVKALLVNNKQLINFGIWLNKIWVGSNSKKKASFQSSSQDTCADRVTQNLRIGLEAGMQSWRDMRKPRQNQTAFVVTCRFQAEEMWSRAVLPHCRLVQALSLGQGLQGLIHITRNTSHSASVTFLEAKGLGGPPGNGSWVLTDVHFLTKPKQPKFEVNCKMKDNLRVPPIQLHWRCKILL